jgi:hypothetical protein
MADLPRGAVTFLFTDIEGSTRLVKQLHDRYGEVLGRPPQSHSVPLSYRIGDSNERASR